MAVEVVVKRDGIPAWIIAEAGCSAQGVKESVSLVLPLGGVGCWGVVDLPLLWHTFAKWMPTLVADFAISRAVISAYPGWGAPALAVLVAVGAQLIVVSSLVLFDLVLFDTAVLATCGIYTLAL